MIEKLFTSKNRVKILSHLFFENEQSYIRELSKNLKISPSAVKKEIDNLINLNILKQKDNKIILNENCNYLLDLKNILLKTDYIIYPIKKELNKRSIKFVILFGSFAKGNYKKESDIDLILIGDLKQSEAFKLIKKIETKINKSINPIVWNEEDFKVKKTGRFFKEIISNKYVLIKGDKDEFQRIIREQ